MEVIKDFLESSTIHGMAHISTARKNVRLFWGTIVVAAFISASVLIHQSFKSWHEDPVKTTEETLPIREIKFPKVTVCPPKNTYTDLNYDLIMAEKMIIDNDTRLGLTNYALELLYDHMQDNIMRNLSKLEDNDRYFNWYHGYTEIILPYNTNYGIDYTVRTSAVSGNISEHFGDYFNPGKVDKNFVYIIGIKPPPQVRNLGNTDVNYFIYVEPSQIESSNITFHIEMEKLSMKGLSIGKDQLYLADSFKDEDENRISYNTTSLRDAFIFTRLERQVISSDVDRQLLDKMPGFRITWNYSGVDLEPWAEFSESIESFAFVRDTVPSHKCQMNIKY